MSGSVADQAADVAFELATMELPQNPNLYPTWGGLAQEAWDGLPILVMLEVQSIMERFLLEPVSVLGPSPTQGYQISFKRAVADQQADSSATLESDNKLNNIQRAYVHCPVMDGKPDTSRALTCTLVDYHFPDMQPLAWKTSEVNDRTWTTFDETIHRPDPQKYPLQHQQWQLFHDPRRSKLMHEYQAVTRDNKNTYLTTVAEFGPYIFENGRPERCWTVGGKGSEEQGFAKGQMSSLGGCMYSYDEADVLCFTEAEHCAWAKDHHTKKLIKIIDKDFNKRRPAVSLLGFLDKIDRKAVGNDILIDVQKLGNAADNSENTSAAVQMRLKDAAKEIRAGLNDKPVSNKNAPINALNITNLARGHTPEGWNKCYTMLDECVEFAEAKVFRDLADMVGHHAIGKSVAVVKHHSDITKCGQFSLAANRGAISLWHQDANGVNTFAAAEKLSDDPDEAPDAVVKYWPSFPMYHMTPEEEKVAWDEYLKEGVNWRPEPAGGIPVIALIPGMFLIQPPGNIHAPITLTACHMVGGMAWKEHGFQETMKAMTLTASHPDCTNEDVPRQIQEIFPYIANEIEANPTRYGYKSNSTEDLKDFYDSLKIIWSAVPGVECKCKDKCVPATCTCIQANLKCGTECHKSKVFDHKKSCNAWKHKDVSATKSKRKLIQGPRDKKVAKERYNPFEIRDEDAEPEPFILPNGKRRRPLVEPEPVAKRRRREDSEPLMQPNVERRRSASESQPGSKRRRRKDSEPAILPNVEGNRRAVELQPDEKRQRREDSDSQAPAPKMSAKEKARLGMPCTNCDRDEIRTHYNGPTGNSLCCTCNTKWSKAGKPNSWGSMKVAAAAAATVAPPPALAPTVSRSAKPAPPSVLSPHSVGGNASALKKNAGAAAAPAPPPAFAAASFPSAKTGPPTVLSPKYVFGKVNTGKSVTGAAAAVALPPAFSQYSSLSAKPAPPSVLSPPSMGGNASALMTNPLNPFRQSGIGSPREAMDQENHAANNGEPRTAWEREKKRRTASAKNGAGSWLAGFNIVKSDPRYEGVGMSLPHLTYDMPQMSSYNKMLTAKKAEKDRLAAESNAASSGAAPALKPTPSFFGPIPRAADGPSFGPQRKEPVEAHSDAVDNAQARPKITLKLSKKNAAAPRKPAASKKPMRESSVEPLRAPERKPERVSSSLVNGNDNALVVPNSPPRRPLAMNESSDDDALVVADSPPRQRPVPAKKSTSKKSATVKKEATAKPAAEKKAKVTKAKALPRAKPLAQAAAPAPAQPAKRTSRRGGGSLVELDMWAQKGATAAKKQPPGKQISDVIISRGKVVKVEGDMMPPPPRPMGDPMDLDNDDRDPVMTGIAQYEEESDSELSVHNDSEFGRSKVRKA